LPDLPKNRMRGAARGFGHCGGCGAGRLKGLTRLEFARQDQVGMGREEAALGGRVLLIEDEANIAEAIRFLLMRDGCEVVVQATGTGAAERLAEVKPDLVILDVMLPGRSGFDILAEIRASPETAALPVIMLTAKGQGADRAAAEKAGASIFMTKPFANAEIRAAVRLLLERGA
jgi:DNA-binding response OmpR family regulator